MATFIKERLEDNPKALINTKNGIEEGNEKLLKKNDDDHSPHA